MGTLINFFNQHITPARERDEYFVQQFPCEEKHSYNPHYQHNLSTSPSFSTPPSLSSSPSNSSPSSAYSSSLNSSFSRATGARAFNQDSHMHQYNYNQSYNASNSSLVSSNNKHDYSYHRHYNRRQNLRCYTNQQQQQEPYVGEWMFGIAEDDDDDYCGASTMARASPQEAPISPSSSYSAVSLKSSLSRKSKAQRANVMNTVTFSPVVLEHPMPSQEQQKQKQQPWTSSSLGLLPKISESNIPTLASESIATATFGTSASISSSNQQQPDTGRMTAKQSLMRIAHCSKSDDGWCSLKAGQHTQHYADASTRSMRVEGRRSRRL
ncbi:hypothetical protein BGX26_001220 [Mortierella sp. AD094]|nr:hypothetical protein BGX26_001220 [Mortierella sp. AD094]